MTLCDEGSVPDPVEFTREPTPEEIQLMNRFLAMHRRMRAEGRFNLGTWLEAVDAGMGGMLILQAPCESRKRAVPEARYVSDGVRLHGIDDIS